MHGLKNWDVLCVKKFENHLWESLLFWLAPDTPRAECDVWQVPDGAQPQHGGSHLRQVRSCQEKVLQGEASAALLKIYSLLFFKGPSGQIRSAWKDTMGYIIIREMISYMIKRFSDLSLIFK